MEVDEEAVKKLTNLTTRILGRVEERPNGSGNVRGRTHAWRRGRRRAEVGKAVPCVRVVTRARSTSVVGCTMKHRVEWREGRRRVVVVLNLPGAKLLVGLFGAPVLGSLLKVSPLAEREARRANGVEVVKNVAARDAPPAQLLVELGERATLLLGAVRPVADANVVVLELAVFNLVLESDEELVALDEVVLESANVGLELGQVGLELGRAMEVANLVHPRVGREEDGEDEEGARVPRNATEGLLGLLVPVGG